ncbi:Glucan endo-1,3-beta-glucosidase A1 precursor [Rubripirellula tenax]|uniref:Glucan endo-1,3-beta-glucosidase A1 n=1 Tax=Rubripirellula tenax TaxID=2528015 RepID=A0A5C6FB86_9BACT|nr:glycoside hydrolase family 16 protein [Rubripirellula tenax]TWU56839.1 Glucan endo-1,3-beta-glucosidase A1 precursor [Rubripirellula tenax]
MKCFLIVSVFVFLGLSSQSLTAQEAVLEPQVTANKALKLVWSDEFDGDSLDYSKWGVEENAFGGGNNELQLFTDREKNVRVEDGYLVLEAHRDNANISGTEREYSSARIRTKHRGDWKYGRIEVRAKLPIGQGMWPAIWMLPTDNKYGTWAASGEIDIMEYRGQKPNEVLGTLHYGGVWPKNKYSGETFVKPEGNFAEDFHTFSVDWTEGKIVWSIDGKPYQTQTKWTSDGGEFPAPFDQKFHLLLNLSVGGNFLGNPDETTQFPQKMLVDFVHVYQ